MHPCATVYSTSSEEHWRVAYARGVHPAVSWSYAVRARCAKIKWNDSVGSKMDLPLFALHIQGVLWANRNLTEYNRWNLDMSMYEYHRVWIILNGHNAHSYRPVRSLSVLTAKAHHRCQTGRRKNGPPRTGHGQGDQSIPSETSRRGRCEEWKTPRAFFWPFGSIPLVPTEPNFLHRGEGRVLLPVGARRWETQPR